MFAVVMKRSTKSLTSIRFETTMLVPTISYEEISTLVCGGCGHNDSWRRKDRRRGHDDEGGVEGHLPFYY